MFFLSFRERVVESYDSLFGGSSEQGLDSTSNFGTKWGWYQSIYAIAQGDVTKFKNITKLPLFQCLK